jgi:hypothetical protein
MDSCGIHGVHDQDHEGEIVVPLKPSESHHANTDSEAQKQDDDPYGVERPYLG